MTATFKERLKRHDLLCGTMVFEFFTPGIAQIVRAAGADFILYDMEHSGADVGTMKAQFAHCRGLPLAPLVRVPVNEYHFIARVLDAGAHGVMVPMVDSFDDAARAVRSMQYPPVGRRGSAFGMAHDDYLPGAPVDKIAAARAKSVLIALIETPGGVAAAEAIAALPGVDMLWLGHFDLTNFMGIPGQFDHPEYLAAVDRIVAAARRHGKPAGFLALDEDWARRYHAKGFRVLAYGLDSQLLQGALRRGIEGIRSL